MLDQFDDTLAAIHHLSKGLFNDADHFCANVYQGQVKVIIAPHDAHALRASNDVPCDAYCKKLDGAFLDFYSGDECTRNGCVEVAVADLFRPRALQDAA
jgi:hypothetical protein